MTDTQPIITFSTAWYILKSKFSPNHYIEWITNFLSMVTHFNLVIYTNKKSYKMIKHFIKKKNPRMLVIYKNFNEFYNYKYEKNWIHNHNKINNHLHSTTCWELNMLWNEKIHFVNETIQKKYFNTSLYGWCDIGYFRNSVEEMKLFTKWPNKNTLLHPPFTEDVVHYGCIQNDDNIYHLLQNNIKLHYQEKQNVSPSEYFLLNCFAGGFFILNKNVIDKYVHMYDQKVQYYFKNDYFIKDDQNIILDCIFNEPEFFHIHYEKNPEVNNWFMFQRILW